MKLLFIFFLLIPQKVDLNELRDLFTKIGDDEMANNQLYILTEGYTMDYKPTVFAYHAASIMTKANYSFWPTDKWSYFSEGKEKLEKVIKSYPNILELRYIRYAIQYSSPSFLGYRDEMEGDKKMLLNNMNKQGWTSSFIRQVKALLNK